jgi:four helix bundle protein
LNIAEGSTSQTDAEQGRFINYAIRSLIEVSACLRIMERRGYLIESALKSNTENVAHQLFIKLQAFSKCIEIIQKK